MRVLIIPDKFKGSLKADKAAEAIAEVLVAHDPKVRATVLPLSDGGDGFVETLTGLRGGTVRTMTVKGPHGEPVRARYGLLDDGTAIVDIAEGSGLRHVPLKRRDPEVASAAGTGVLLRKLIERGAKRIIVGLGGSSTTDGGIGLLAPLGWKFLDSRGREVSPNGRGLARVAKIVKPEAMAKVEWLVATDVDNPLHGPAGASFVFGPQKGAKPAGVKRMDGALKGFAKLAEATLAKDTHRVVSTHEAPGAGAAGGAGYGLMTFLGARRVLGFDLFCEWSGLMEQIKRHDLIITGEGALDETSVGGKGPWMIAELAKKHGKRVWAVCGVCRLKEGRAMPFDAIAQLVEHAPTAEAAQKRAGYYVRKATEGLVAEHLGKKAKAKKR